MKRIGIDSFYFFSLASETKKPFYLSLGSNGYEILFLDNRFCDSSIVLIEFNPDVDQLEA